MNFRDILLALLVIILWAGNIIAIKIGVTELPPMVMITLRFVTTALLFLPFMRWPGKRTFWKLVEIALYMSVLHQGLLFIAMDMLKASTMSILLQSQILFATILGFLILGEKIGPRTGFGLLIGFCGLFLTLGGPDLSQNPWGFIVTMGSTLALAFSYIRMRQIKKVHAPTFIAIMNGAAVPFVALFSIILSSDGWMSLPKANWIPITSVLVYQALFVSLSHVVWQILLARNEVAKVTCFVLLMPILAIFLSTIILNETLYPALLWGGGMTLIGVAIITVRKIQKRQPLQNDPVL